MRLNPIPMLLTLAAALACASAPSYPARSALHEGTLAAEAPAASTASAPSSGDGPKLICSLERPTGSNIMRRVCRSQDQVDRDREAAQALLMSPHGASRP